MLRRLFAGLLMATLQGHGALADDDFRSIYLSAVENNPAYLAARAAFDADQEAEAIALGRLLPTLDVTGSYRDNTTERQFGATAQENFDYKSRAYGMNLRQPIYRKQLLAAYGQAGAQEAGARARFQGATNDLIGKLTEAYLQVLFADDQLNLLDAQETALTAQLAAAEASFRAGSGSRIEIDEARSRLDTTRAEKVEQTNQRAHAQRNLEAIAARRIDLIARLDSSRLDLSPPSPADPEAWITLAEAYNPDILFARANVEVAQQEVEKALATHYPTLDLVASAVKTSNDSAVNLTRTGDSRFYTKSVGVELNIPLFAGGTPSALTRQAQARLTQARYQLDSVRQQVAVNIRRELANVTQGQFKIGALSQALTSAEQALTSSRNGVRAGTRTTLDVLAAQQQVFVAARDLAQGRYLHILAYVRLIAISKKFADSDLARVADWLSGAPSMD